VDWWSDDPNDHSQYERDVHRDGDGWEQLQREHQQGVTVNPLPVVSIMPSGPDNVLRGRECEPDG